MDAETNGTVCEVLGSRPQVSATCVAQELGHSQFPLSTHSRH